jgi:hypothetical protein
MMTGRAMVLSFFARPQFFPGRIRGGQAFHFCSGFTAPAADKLWKSRRPVDGGADEPYITVISAIGFPERAARRHREFAVLPAPLPRASWLN